MPAITSSESKPAKPKSQEQSEVADAMSHYRLLRWFAVVSMLAIVSWVLIDLFGPIPKYQLKNYPVTELNSPEFLNELAALAGSHADSSTHVDALPNGMNFYEAELAAIQLAQKSIDWEAYIFAKGDIARLIVDALAE